MGTWGTSLFADDDASDLRDEYRQLVGDGMAGPEATDKLIAQWAPIGDPNLEPVFWLALALTQWSCGRLEDRVKEQGLQVIADGSAIRPWAGVPDERKRRAVLEAAKRKLESPQPAVRIIKKRVLSTCDWERGELIGYRLKTGDYVVLRMLDRHVDLGGASPVCELLDWRGPEIPAEGPADTTPVLLELETWGRGKRMLICSTGKRFLKDRLKRLNVKHTLAETYSRVPRGHANPSAVTSWTDFDKFLESRYGVS